MIELPLAWLLRVYEAESEMALHEAEEKSKLLRRSQNFWPRRWRRR